MKVWIRWWQRVQDTRDVRRNFNQWNIGEEKSRTTFGNLWAGGWTNEKGKNGLFMKVSVGKTVQFSCWAQNACGICRETVQWMMGSNAYIQNYEERTNMVILIKIVFLRIRVMFLYSLTRDYEKLYKSTLVIISKFSGMMMLYHYLFKFVFPPLNNYNSLLTHLPASRLSRLSRFCIFFLPLCLTCSYNFVAISHPTMTTIKILSWCLWHKG